MNKFSTELFNRELRFDGVSVVPASEVASLFLQGLKPKDIRVKELTKEIEHFNLNVVPEERLKLDVDEVKLDYSWLLPDEYLELDIEKYVIQKFESKVSELNYSDNELTEAIERIDTELTEFKKNQMLDLIRSIIFLIDTFNKENQIWGVGRGSSCASYILFLLGLHLVDPIKYDIPLEEFLHD